MCLAAFKSQCLCLFLFKLLRGRTGRRMAEGGRFVKPVWRELWRLPGKHGVLIHTDSNPESCSGKASRDCHTNHEEKKQTAPDSWCQRYLQATKWLKGKREFLSVVLFDSGRRKRGRAGCQRNSSQQSSKELPQAYFYLWLVTSYLLVLLFICLFACLLKKGKNGALA